MLGRFAPRIVKRRSLLLFTTIIVIIEVQRRASLRENKKLILAQVSMIYLGSLAKKIHTVDYFRKESVAVLPLILLLSRSSEERGRNIRN